jgi:hypothetical protein
MTAPAMGKGHAIYRDLRLYKKKTRSWESFVAKLYDIIARPYICLGIEKYRFIRSHKDKAVVLLDEDVCIDFIRPYVTLYKHRFSSPKLLISNIERV